MSQDNLGSQEEIEIRQDIEFSRNLRKRIINESVEHGIPTAEDNRAFLMDALNGLDRLTMSRSKIKSEEKTAKSQQQVAGLIAQVLTGINAKQVHPTRNTEELPSIDHPVQTVNGETVTGTQNISIQEILPDQD